MTRINSSLFSTFREMVWNDSLIDSENPDSAGGSATSIFSKSVAPAEQAPVFPADGFQGCSRCFLHRVG